MDLRRVLNGIFYVNKTGCQWRMMPKDLGHGHTIYGYFSRWRREGVWACVMDTLRQWERPSQGRVPTARVSRRQRKGRTSALMGTRKSQGANGISWSIPVG
jgi:putative transposase